MARNPVLEVLNMAAKAPANVPQAAIPTAEGPTQQNLSSVPAPMMQPARPALPTELPASTTSLDLPASLSGLMGSGSPQVAVNERAIQPFPMGTTAVNPQFPAFDFRLQPTYADGGMVGQGGIPVRPAGMNPQQPQGQAMSPQMVEMQIQEFMRTQPQAVAEIQRAIMAGFQSGELTPQELNQAGQLAMTALQNPEMYPYVRNFAIQQGIATEQDLPAQYDQGLVIVLVTALRAVQQMSGAMGMGGSMGSVPQTAQEPMPRMQNGGRIPQSMSPSNDTTGRRDDVTIKASSGEYIIPKHVVEAKGTEFFDKLLEAYSSKAKEA
jgi:hypothetical protein